jgi:hypothetical protein
VYLLQLRHIIAWPALLTEHRRRPSASSSQEPSQSHCAGAYTAAVGLVAQSHGAGRTKERPLCDRGLGRACVVDKEVQEETKDVPMIRAE